MKVGIDYGVFSEAPDRFGSVATSLLDGGHEVYLTATVSERNGDRIFLQVQSMALPHTVISMIVCNREDEVQENLLEYCLTNKIDMFMDTREEVCRVLRKNGIIALKMIA